MRTLLTAAIVLLLTANGCAVTSHPVTPSPLGRATTTADLLRQVREPGPLEVASVTSADWAIDRAGLINLEHPRAKEAGLTDGAEPIQLYFHVLRHPEHGTFIIDTGVERALRDAPEEAAVRGMVASVMKADSMTIHTPLGEWLEREQVALSGVLLTHLHLDHVTGMPDVPRGVPVYTGPGETRGRSFQNLFTRSTINRTLEGMGPIREWPYAARPAQVGSGDEQTAFDGVVDVFGDGSLFALWVPGHTEGSTAYLARTAEGPVLFVGDACHTAWGWENDVEPGTFTADHDANARSLARLRALVAAHPGMQVRLGHQAHAH